MNCPVCKTVSLATAELESDLVAFTCRQCGGDWVRDSLYRSWREKQGEDLPEKPGDGATIQLTNVEFARLCPDCNRILVKYKVGRDVNFTVDRCGGCGGVWLDKDEWTTLKERNLHDNLYDFFTESWQSEVRREETRKKLEAIYEQKFGAEAYAEIKRFKAWMDEQPSKTEIVAFLNDANPLGA
jgi:Zn-finger nucleic acid-binding protein